MTHPSLPDGRAASILSRSSRPGPGARAAPLTARDDVYEERVETITDFNRLFVALRLARFLKKSKLVRADRAGRARDR